MMQENDAGRKGWKNIHFLKKDSDNDEWQGLGKKVGIVDEKDAERRRMEAIRSNAVKWKPTIHPHIFCIRKNNITLLFPSSVIKILTVS